MYIAIQCHVSVMSMYYVYNMFSKIIGICSFHAHTYLQLLQVLMDSQPLPPHLPHLLCHGIRIMQQLSITGLAVVGMD